MIMCAAQEKNKNNIDVVSSLLQQQFCERFSLNQTIREHHAQNTTWLPKRPPDGVFFPNSTAEIAEAVKLCNQYNVPVIPYGCGSSLEGQVNAPFGGICIDLSNMNQVINVLPDDMHAVIQPGVTRNTLNSYLRDTGLFFPIDPGADASIGGMAATRASGTNAVRYGTMRENVLSLEVVLADGKVVRTGTRAKKSAAGYDLTRLMVGSEGTLGIITELTVKLYGLPQSIASGVCCFPTIQDACHAVILASQLGIDLARVELLDETSIRACNRYSKLNLKEAPTLFVEFHGTKNHTEHEIADFNDIIKEFNGEEFAWSHNEQERAALWKARHDAWWAIHALFPGKTGVSTDACIPISRLAECIQASQEDIKESKLNAAVIGHVGDGNFHVLVLMDKQNDDEMARAKEFINRMSERAIKMGGTCTGEHGIGQGKINYMPIEHGESLDCMRAIKTALDPKHILNPGKVFYA